MDAAEPPQIVFETPAPCSDARRAQGLLEQALVRAQAPASGWSVTMRVAAMGAGVLQAEGAIKDDHGAPVGHRALHRKATDCSGLARAIGLWASLVLDAESHRPKAIARSDGGLPPAPDEGTPPIDAASPAAAARARPIAPDADPGTPGSPTLGPEEKLLADRDADRESLNRREDGKTFEIGAGTFLMTGTGGGLAAGVTPFLLVEAGKGFFVRPALLFGESLPSSGPDVTLAATRGDACLRVAGLYTSRNGMQLDMCVGADLGLLRTSRTLPYVALGPSLDLRGELGGDLAVLLRGLFDVNVVQIQGDSLDTPLWAGRVELALSWRLR